MLSVEDDKIPPFHMKNPHSGALFTPHSHHDTYEYIRSENANLEGAAVFVTGASRGVGRGIAIAYAKAGASFIGLGARGRTDDTIESLQAAAKAANKPAPKVLPLSLDITNREAVRAAVEQVTAEFGRLDILVNNAGAKEAHRDVGDSDPDDWWQTYEVNVKGAYLMTHAFLPLLLDSPNGMRQLVNVISQGALLIIKGMSSYNSSKLAACRFTEYVADEYAERGLIATAVHPGGVESDMSNDLPPDLRAAVITETAELVSDTIVWISKERREWLSGRYISVLWDMAELVEQKDRIVKEDLLKSKLAI